LKGLPFLIFWFLFSSALFGQDLEPRRWTEIPVGKQVIGVGYAFSFGEVFFDPILQAENATVEMNTIGVSYVLPVRIGKKLGRIDATIPFVFEHWEGTLSGVPSSLNRTGFADPIIRFSVNILGASAEESKNLREYITEHSVRTTVGLSIAVTLPFGQYFDEKLINLGHNRFVFRPQAGMIHTWNKWSFELTASTFLITNNNNFYGGMKKKQAPIFAIQSHLIKRFKPGYWASLSAGFGSGGKSIINNQSREDRRVNLLGAISVGFPLDKNQGAKITYLRNQALESIGADVNSFIIGWSYMIN
jgi:hypothetical protein